MGFFNEKKKVMERAPVEAILPVGSDFYVGLLDWISLILKGLPIIAPCYGPYVWQPGEDF